MNKFQKAALQIAKDDAKNIEWLRDMPLKVSYRSWYKEFKGNKERWNYQCVLDLKRRNKLGEI